MRGWLVDQYMRYVEGEPAVTEDLVQRRSASLCWPAAVAQAHQRDSVEIVLSSLTFAFVTASDRSITFAAPQNSAMIAKDYSSYFLTRSMRKWALRV